MPLGYRQIYSPPALPAIYFMEHKAKPRSQTLQRSHSLSSVNGKGIRSILPGKYTLSLGGAQPQENTAKSEAGFTVTGLLGLHE
jgi:hypothetical protein